MSASANARVRSVVSATWFRVAARSLVGLGVLIAVAAQVGSGPFLRGLSSIDPRAIAAALALSATATVAAAWRWSVIAERLGVGLRLPDAIGMYYRSQFLNTVLPGGVVGDVERAVTQGRNAGSVPQAARAVIIERTVGQVVQIALAVVIVAWSGSEYEGVLLSTLGIGLMVLVLAALATAAASVRVRRVLRRELDELSAGVGSPGAFVRVVAASIVVVGCHVATLGVAAAAVGASVPPLRLAALALVVLLAGSIPLNIGGWGPREGVAGWTFAVAGLGASTGVAASALFGVLAMIGVVPGLVLAVMAAVRRTRSSAPAPDVVLAGADGKVGS
ncbi:lysylphosphatidylglycerol synthase transmembrane domain-containing protein [Agromyces bauzanensis]